MAFASGLREVGTGRQRSVRESDLGYYSSARRGDKKVRAVAESAFLKSPRKMKSEVER